MDTPKIFIHNIETGEQTLRDMTADEIAELFEPTDEVPPTGV
jgi:hypothetical protein